MAFVPLVIKFDCFNMENTKEYGMMECNDFATVGVTALLIIASFLSLLINPTPIVNEPNDVLQKPEETLILDSKTALIEF